MEQVRPTTGGLLAIAAGAALGVAYTLSPLTVWFIPIAALLIWWGGRGATPREQRWIAGLLVASIAIRLALLIGLFLFVEPELKIVPFSTFFGDEQYMIARALRQRAFWLGASMTSEGFHDLYEQYGRTSYLQVLALVQVVVGPAPYGVRLLSIAMYLAAAIGMHRIVRRAYGPAVALGSLALILFLPSLVLWSAAALKESLNFLLIVSMIGSAILTARAPWRWRPVAALGVVASLAWLTTLRDGAAVIAAGGLGAGIALAVATRNAWRLAAAAVVIVLAVSAIERTPRVEAAAMEVVSAAALKHRGHVYTPGHGYELMDPGFYGGPRSIRAMTRDEAARFVGRGVASVLLFPLPWQMRSRAELTYLPEQLIWYLLVATAPLGFVVGLRRDRLTTSMFTGYAVLVLLAVGVNSGNMGTLVRHRTLALPYVGVLAVLGIASLLGRFGCRDTEPSCH